MKTRKTRPFVLAVAVLIFGTFLIQSAAAQTNVVDATPTLPPNAKPGQCWTKAMIPGEFKTEKISFTKSEATERIEVIPAEYATSEVRQLVKEATTVIEAVPAVYETKTEVVETAPASTAWFSGSSSNKRASESALAAAGDAGIKLGSAKSGDCFVEYAVAPTYKTETVRVLTREAGKKITVTPAVWETVTERVMVAEASKRMVEVPAEYETVTERILIQPAAQEWKKGTGPIQKLDETTGEIMCLVDVPAKYETVSKRVVKTPATTRMIDVPAKYETRRVRKLKTPAREVSTDVPATYENVTKRSMATEGKAGWFAKGATGTFGKPTGRQVCRRDIPAKTKTVTKRVIKTPATTRKVEVPAEYTTVKVTKMVTPPRENRIKVPAVPGSVTKRTKVSDDRLEWRSILCQTNATPALVTEIQTALRKAGHNPGPIDGALGAGTMRAAEAYQASKGLGRGGITMETLKSLGVTIGG